MNSLDSRYLSLGDTFAQRFTEAGAYKYAVTSRGSLDCGLSLANFGIKVAEDAGPASQTHYVTVSFTNGVYFVDVENIEIRKNDVVLWSATAATTAGFAVSGRERRA